MQCVCADESPPPAPLSLDSSFRVAGELASELFSARRSGSREAVEAVVKRASKFSTISLPDADEDEDENEPVGHTSLLESWRADHGDRRP